MGMMQRAAGILVIGMVGTLTGCGGSVPGLTPLSNSLSEGGYGTARAQSSRAQRLVQRSPWNVSTLRSR
jgi:hypothetical protein